MSRLDLVVGPNGSGKTTYVEQVLLAARPGLPFVNADVIAAQRWPDDAVAMARQAARVAAATRDALIEARLAFAAETVFSHPSKVELVRRAAAAGFEVNLHVLLIPLSLSAPRVAHRVLAGGHDVPLARLAPRYERIWPLVVESVPSCTTVTFLDNSRQQGPRVLGTLRHGVPDAQLTWPDWAPPPLLLL